MFRKIATIAAALALIVVMAPTASADPPPNIDGGGTSLGTGGNGVNNGGPTPPGGGSSPVPVYGTILTTWIPGTSGVCARMPDGRYSNGSIGKYRYDAPIISSVNGIGSRILVSSSCTYPPPPNISPVTCALSVTLTGNGPMSNPTVASGTIYGPKTVNSAWAGNRSSPAACASSVTQTAQVPLTQFGRYLLNATSNP